MIKNLDILIYTISTFDSCSYTDRLHIYLSSIFRMTDRHHELLVIGAGHMRTGTNSLKLALEKLYGQKCYHMIEIIDNHSDHIGKWINILDEDHMDKEICDKLFQGYCCTVDYPSSLFYRDLMNIYPNAKVILTTRDAKSWIESVKNTTLKAMSLENIFLRFYLWVSAKSRFPEFKEKMFLRIFHSTLPSDKILQESFESFNEEVRQTVPKERLLELNIKEGWKPLCKFLDLPIPNEPFPFVNSTKEFQNNWKKRMFKFSLTFGSLITVLVASGVLLLKNYLEK